MSEQQKSPAQCVAKHRNWPGLLSLREVMKTAHRNGGDRLMSVWDRDLEVINWVIDLLSSDGGGENRGPAETKTGELLDRRPALIHPEAGVASGPSEASPTQGVDARDQIERLILTEVLGYHSPNLAGHHHVHVASTAAAKIMDIVRRSLGIRGRKAFIRCPCGLREMGSCPTCRKMPTQIEG